MNRAAARAPLQLLQIDIDAGEDAVDMIDPAGAFGVVRVAGAGEARRALALQRYDLIVLDPGAAGEAAGVILLDTLPAKNVTTPVLLLCDLAPSEAWHDRANLVLLKHMTAAPALWRTIRALTGSALPAAPWSTP